MLSAGLEVVVCDLEITPATTLASADKELTAPTFSAALLIITNRERRNERVNK
jgi:hypothetical protein